MGHWAPPSNPNPFHPIALQCPAHSHYTNCLPACSRSCTDLDGHCEGTSPKVPSPCKEGCLCQPGYFLNNGKCVLQTHCDCKDAEGGLVPVSGCGKRGRWLGDQVLAVQGQGSKFKSQVPTLSWAWNPQKLARWLARCSLGRLATMKQETRRPRLSTSWRK